MYIIGKPKVEIFEDMNEFRKRIDGLNTPYVCATPLGELNCCFHNKDNQFRVRVIVRKLCGEGILSNQLLVYRNTSNFPYGNFKNNPFLISFTRRLEADNLTLEQIFASWYLPSDYLVGGLFYFKKWLKETISL